LREEFLVYFGLPMFSKLSEAKLQYEVENCQDSRLLEAVENIKKSMDNSDSSLQLQTKFFSKFVQIILNSFDLEYVEEAIKFITILLAQPSCRRFIRPLLEDTLFGSVIKYKNIQQDILQDFENVFYFPIDEVCGVYYEYYEDFVVSHFLKVRSLQTKLFSFPGFELISRASQNTFMSYGNILQSISALNTSQLNQILFQIGIDGYSQELADNILIDAIASHLFLRQNVHVHLSSASIYPTEVNDKNRQF
jgi:hypothetical protein